MTTRLRIALVTCLLVFILMDANPVLAKKGGGKLKKLEDRVKELEKSVGGEEECKACQLIDEIMKLLNETFSPAISSIDELKERLNEMGEEIEKLKNPPNPTLPPATTLPPTPTISEGQVCKFDFEDGIDGWEKNGTVFNNQPTYGDNPTARKREQPANQQGDWWIGGFEDRPSKSAPPGGTQGDGPQGTLTSPSFNIRGKNISFLIGGGCDIKLVRAELIIGDKVVKTMTGKCTETMTRKIWDVGAFIGQSARVKLVDFSSGGWGHINFDDLKGDISCGPN